MKELEQIKARIISLFEEFKLKQVEVAEDLGLKPGSVSTFVSGRTKVTMRMYLYVLDKFPEITDEWLRTGKGEKYRGNRVGERQVPYADEEKVSGMELRLMRGHVRKLEAFIKENHPPEVAKALLIKE